MRSRARPPRDATCRSKKSQERDRQRPARRPTPSTSPQPDGREHAGRRRSGGGPGPVDARLDEFAPRRAGRGAGSARRSQVASSRGPRGRGPPTTEAARRRPVVTTRDRAAPRRACEAGARRPRTSSTTWTTTQPSPRGPSAGQSAHAGIVVAQAELRGVNASSRNGDGTRRVVRRESASAGPGSTRRTPAGAPPRRRADGSVGSATDRALGKRPASMPMTTTWSNSRPFVAWAVASVSGGVVAAKVGESRARVADGRPQRRATSGTARGHDAHAPATRAPYARAPRRSGVVDVAAQRRRGPGRARRATGSPGVGGRSASVEQPVHVRRTRAAVDPRRPERQAELERDGDRRQQLAVRPRQDRPRRAVVRPASAIARAQADRLVGRRRAPGRGGRRRRPGRIRFANRSLVVLDEPDGPLDDRTRAAVVDLEVDATQARQSVRRAPGSGGRRRVASRRSTGRRRRRGRSGSPARPAAGRARAAPDRRPGPRRRAARRSAAASGRGAPDRVRAIRIARRMRSSKSRPPVAATAALVGDEGARHRARPPGRPRRPRPSRRARPSAARYACRAAAEPAASAHGADARRRTAARSASGSIATPGVARGSRARGRGTSGPGPCPARRRAARRPRRVARVISIAARLLKVIARIDAGSASRSR